MSLFNKHKIMVESTVQRSTSNQKQVKLLTNSMSGVRITSQRYTPTFEPTEPKSKPNRKSKKKLKETQKKRDRIKELRTRKKKKARKQPIIEYADKFQIYSVGGNDYDRSCRDRLTKDIGFLNSSVETLQPNEKPWMLKDALTSWIPHISRHESFPQATAGSLYEQLSTGTKHLVYLCGHYDPTRFNKVVLENIARIDYVGVMGPGFNYLDFGNKLSNWKALRSNLGVKLKGFGFGAATFLGLEPQKPPPSYSSKDVWDKEILPHYPPELQELRKYNVGGFWITRDPTLIKADGSDGGSKVTTGAFIRQFELHSLIRNGKYDELEKLVVKKLSVAKLAIPGVAKLAIPGVETLMSTINTTVGVDFSTYLTNVMQAYSTWFHNHFDTQSVDMQRSILIEVTQAIFESIVELKPAFKIKEYDAAGLHDFLLRISTSSIVFTSESHLEVLKHVLKDKAAEDEGDLSPRFDAMRAALESRKLHIIGDLGLDPQSDDYLCYALARYLAKTNKEEFGKARETTLK
mgnify:FL=1|tara:strand:- start:9846 stop:11402 length:1557 start_codon:yes stop_codon:yes gene_type:complete